MHNRLDPSGELRARFGEACEVAPDKLPTSNRIVEFRENGYPSASLRTAGHMQRLGMFCGVIDNSCKALGHRVCHFADYITTTAGADHSEHVQHWFQTGQ